MHLLSFLLAHVYPPCHLDPLLFRSPACGRRHSPARARSPSTRRTATRLCPASLCSCRRSGLTHTAHCPATKCEGRCCYNELEKRTRTNLGRHPESINFIKAPLARKDLLDAIRYPLSTRRHPSLRIASGIPRRQDSSRYRRDRLRSRLRPYLAPTAFHASPTDPPELRRRAGRHGAPGE